MTYTEKELDQFLHGISLSLLSKKSAQHWRYDEETAKEIEWLEALERKVRADKADRKTENCSEKPNNCEELNAYRECVKSRSFWDSKHCDGCYFDERCPFDEPKDEPQTEMTTEQIVNEMLSIKKILDDGKMPKQRCGNCKHLTYRWNKTWCDIKCDNPHDMVCDKWKRSE